MMFNNFPQFMYKLNQLHKRLSTLTEKNKKQAKKRSRPSDPAITISIQVDKNGNTTFFADVYSYSLEFKDGKRNHTWSSKNLNDLMRQVDKAIQKEEKTR